jgi:hypothetical protein
MAYIQQHRQYHHKCTPFRTHMLESNLTNTTNPHHSSFPTVLPFLLYLWFLRFKFFWLIYFFLRPWLLELV